MPGSPDCRAGGIRMAIAHAQEAQQLGAQGVLLLPHYLTEVSQQGLAAHVEAVYRSVSLGENSQLAGKAARPPARSSFHQWLATDGKARKWTVLAIWDDDTKVSELSGSREPNLDNFRPLA